MSNPEEIIPRLTDVGALGNRINGSAKCIHNVIDKTVSGDLGLALKNPKLYRQGLQSFYHVFQTIERQHEYLIQNEAKYDQRIINIIKEIWKPSFRRTERLENDLSYFYSDESKFKNPIMGKQIEFSQHITKVTTEKPYLILAYFHVMYLALFAGGRILRGSIEKSDIFPKVDGKKHEEVVRSATSFFHFDVENEDDLRASFKRDYELSTRNDLTEEEKQEIIEEAIIIFKKNIECVKELETYNRKKLGIYSKVSTKNIIGFSVACAVSLVLVLKITKSSTSVVY